MKKLAFFTLFALTLTFCALPALAADSADVTVIVPRTTAPQPSANVTFGTVALYPSSVEELRLENGLRQIVKTYELRATDNPQLIPRTAFERDGYVYEIADVTRTETSNAASRDHTETVTVSTETKDTDAILAQLAPSLYYESADGFAGTLQLDLNSLKIESAGTKTSSYTLKAERDYPNMSSNDTSLIPKTITDKGKTLTLANVDWVESGGVYNGHATYTATASGTKNIGYTTTAGYRGKLVKLVDGKTVYTAYFTGTPILPEPLAFTTVTPPPKPEIIAEPSETEGGGLQVGMIIALVVSSVLGLIVGWAIAKKWRKPPIAMLAAAVLLGAMSFPAFAADYEFGTGGDTLGGFGHATSSDIIVTPDPLSTNTRRNKDAAYLPPPYGIFSGGIPTAPSSPYHDNLPQSGFVPANQDLPAIGNEDYAPGSSNVSSGLLPSTSQTTALNTMPWLYDDGTIGALYVASTKKTIKVYEGEGLDNLAKGAGHFVSTSAWDGNVALASHNRNGYFGWLKDAKVGDRVTYTTRYGTRTYEVYSKTQVDEYDNAGLGYSAENTLTLFTCVENVSNLRWCVVAKEVAA